jgi:hypothetical protein
MQNNLHIIQFPYTLNETDPSDEQSFVMYANMLHKLRALCPHSNISLSIKPFGNDSMGKIFRFLADHNQYGRIEISLRLDSYESYMVCNRGAGKRIAKNLQELIDFLLC